MIQIKSGDYIKKMKIPKIKFPVFNEMILQQKEDFCFKVRNKRSPLDNVNALLSFTYSLCTNMCASALESVGLDPYVDFMHTDRPGRRSLALDLVEEFRAWMCDRFVRMLINKKIVNGDGFEKRTLYGRRTSVSR